MQSPLVTVLMPCYREAPAVLRESVLSIIGQTYQNLEVLIIVDDPQNAELIAELDEFCTRDRRIRLELNSKNLGLQATLNKGIALASGDYICRMDADDIALETRVEDQLDELVSRGLDLIGGRVEVIDESGSSLYEAGAIPLAPKDVSRGLRWNNCVPHPTWFGTKETFSQLYRPIPLCEDYDFLLRASLSGKRIGNYAGIVLKYRMAAESLSRTHLYEQYLYQVYLTGCYARGNVAQLEDARRFVARKFKARKSLRYSEANAHFNSAVNLWSSKHAAAGVAQAAKVPFTSPAYMRKVYRLGRVALLSRKARPGS